MSMDNTIKLIKCLGIYMRICKDECKEIDMSCYNTDLKEIYKEKYIDSNIDFKELIPEKIIKKRKSYIKNNIIKIISGFAMILGGLVSAIITFLNMLFSLLTNPFVFPTTTICIFIISIVSYFIGKKILSAKKNKDKDIIKEIENKVREKYKEHMINVTYKIINDINKIDFENLSYKKLNKNELHEAKLYLTEYLKKQISKSNFIELEIFKDLEQNLSKEINKIFNKKDHLQRKKIEPLPPNKEKPDLKINLNTIENKSLNT